MPEPSPVNDGPSYLKQCQIRVRSLLAEHTWLADAICATFEEFVRLDIAYGEARERNYQRSIGLARQVLLRGHVRDPDLTEHHDIMFVKVTGECPSDLSAQLNGLKGVHPSGELEKESAAAALIALDKMPKYQKGLEESESVALLAGDSWAIDTNSHVMASWLITVIRPAEWLEPINPNSIEIDDLASLSDEDFRTIAIHRLGGLADHCSARPIMTEPVLDADSSENAIEAYRRFALWQLRFPFADEAGPGFGGVTAAAEAADLYNQFLSSIETFCGLVAEIGTRYWLQNQFPEGMDTLLRESAASRRVSKKIFRFNFSGKWYYDVEQARRLWPKHFED